MKIIFRNSVALLLVFTMIFTLGVSVLALDEDMTDEKVELSLEEDIGETINLEDEEAPEEELAPEEEADLEKELAPKEEAVPEEDLDQEDEVDQEELDPEPVDEPEPEPEPEEEEEEPQKKEDSEKVEEAKELEEVEEEYDPGAMLDGFPATPHPGNQTPIIKYAPGSLGSALISQSGFGLMTTGGSGLEPGGVRTSKTATPVPGMVNTWDIKVRIEGRDDEKVETTDVVLVIDRSGSMADNNRMTNAQTAAKNFIDNMIGEDPNLRIAIVSFSSEYEDWWGNTSELVTINHDFSRNISTLKNAVDGLTALGGTHTQAGIIQGEALLDASTADNKYMVLLSDGEPTYSYEPSSWTNGLPSWGTPGGVSNNRQLTGVYDGNYNTGTVVGTGSDLTESYNYSPGWLQPTYRRHIHNGFAAIKAGEDARTGIDGLFTIAVAAGDGTSILQQIASPGMAYSTDNPEDLQEIYDLIGTQIQTQYAIKNAVITDVMGDGFSLISGSIDTVEVIDTTEGTTAVANPSGPNNETITWTINPAVEELVPGTTDVRYAEMTYRVEINDAILGLHGAKTNEHQLFKTNKVTNLSYLDINDENKQVSIDSPEVDPVLLKIKKILLNPNDPENRRFNVKISKEGQNPFNQTVELVPNEDYVWSTKLRHEGTYNVEEISITGDGITNLGGFNISYKVDGDDKDNFLVNHDGSGKPRGDVTIEVTNSPFGEAVPDEPLIRVSKTFSGLTQDQIDSLTNFKITITDQSNSSLTKDLFLGDGDRVVEINGDITYKWKIEGWPAGTYNVVESGYGLTNYTVVIDNEGNVTTVAAEINWTTNLWKKPNNETNNDLRVNGISPNIVATKLSQDEGVFVWTETRLSASQRLAIVEALSDWNELGLTMENGYWYSGDDIAGDDFYFRGYKIQYNHGTGNLHIPQPNQWALIVSGAYVFQGGDPADIAVKNSYTLNTVDVTIEKEVTGNFGDMQGDFEFTVIIDGDEENPEVFNLSHSESKTLKDIPINAVLTLTENAREHDITVLVGSDEIVADTDGSFTIDLSNYQGNITIEVTNHKDELIDTGITFDTLPYILILAVSTLGLGVGFVRKRNIRKED